MLYTLNGTGTAHIGGVEHELRPGVGLFVGRDTSWSLEGESLVELLSVLVHDPQPLAAGTHGAIDLAGAARGEATADRRFTLGVTPDVGCASVTQFIGFVPPGRAPDHFHRYDEVLYVLEGDGVLHIDGRSAPFRRGSARAPAGAPRAQSREHGRHRAAAARRLQARGLASRGVLPRRDAGRRTGAHAMTRTAGRRPPA